MDKGLLYAIIAGVVMLVLIIGAFAVIVVWEKSSGMDEVYGKRAENYERCADKCFEQYETGFKIRRCEDDCYRCHIYKTTCG